MERESDKCRRGRSSGETGGGAVYGLGFIGAAVYFIMQATSFWAGVIGLLKAIVWPAFLVYEAFKRDNNGLRLSLGFGYGWYDMYAGYNRAIIDGQRISTYIPNNNLYKRIILKLIGL